MNFINVISLSQTPGFISMIKHYVAMCFILKIDDMFVASVPKEFSEVVYRLNSAAVLKMGPDLNTNWKIWKRLVKVKF